jgi:hypothetical protein
MAIEEYTLTLTVGDKVPVPFHKIEARSIDEGYGSSSPNSAASTLPMTVSEDVIRSGSPTSAEGWRFRLPWGAPSPVDHGTEQATRLEKEKEAEEFISSLAGRSLSIQRIMIEKILKKEKRRVKFGFSSSKVMDLAIRRYTFKFVPPIQIYVLIFTG